MTSHLDVLIARAIDLGKKTAIVGPKSAAIHARTNKSEEDLNFIRESDALSQSYKESLLRIQQEDPDNFPLHRSGVVAVVREKIKNSPGHRQWCCIVCNHVFDEKLGEPANGIEAGSAFEEIDDDWKCPGCQVGKSQFDCIQEGS